MRVNILHARNLMLCGLFRYALYIGNCWTWEAVEDGTFIQRKYDTALNTTIGHRASHVDNKKSWDMVDELPKSP